jgi:putative heme transporter
MVTWGVAEPPHSAGPALLPPQPIVPLSKGARRAIWLLLWASLAAVALFFRGVALPFLIGGLLAYLLDPVVDKLATYKIRKWPVPRWAAILALFAGGAAIVALLASLTLPHLFRELGRLSAKAADLATQLTPDRLTQLATDLAAWLTRHGVPVGLGGGDDAHFGLSLDPQGSLREAIASLTAAARTHLLELLGLGPRLIGGIVTSVFDALLVLMITAFLLVKPAQIFAFARGLIPHAYQPSYDSLLLRVDRGLAGVVRGQLTICVINGTLTFVGLLIFRVPFAYALALLATACAFVPIFGTFLSSVPIVLAGLSRGWHVGFIMLLWILGVHAIEAYVLNPKVMGDASRIHPLLILFSLLAGERYFGLLGALFAVPAASLAVSLFKHLYAQLVISEPAIEG